MKKLTTLACLVVVALATIEGLQLLGVSVSSSPFWIVACAVIVPIALLLAGPGKNKAKRGGQ